MHALRFSTSFKHDRIITQVPKGEIPQSSRCCPLKFVQFATNLLLLHLIHPIHQFTQSTQFTPLLDVPQLSLPMFKLSKNRVPCITMILHINQTRKNHNPKFRSENEITPIFLRHPPLNLEQFGVLNDCARPTESPPTEFTSTPNYEFDRSPNPPSRCFRQHTHHTHTIRKHFEFLLQLRRQITSLESRLLLPEC
jgi:hypothetical protein